MEESFWWSCTDSGPGHLALSSNKATRETGAVGYLGGHNFSWVCGKSVHLDWAEGPHLGPALPAVGRTPCRRSLRQRTSWTTGRTQSCPGIYPSRASPLEWSTKPWGKKADRDHSKNVPSLEQSEHCNACWDNFYQKKQTKNLVNTETEQIFWWQNV